MFASSHFFKYILPFFLLFFAVTAKSESTYYLGGGVLSEKNDFKLFFGEKTSATLSGDLQYIDFGDLTRMEDKVNAKSLGYALLFKSPEPLFRRVQPFIKLGVHYWEADLETTGNSFSSSGTDPFVGIGANIHIKNDWFFRTEFEKFKFDLEPEGSLKVDLFSTTLIKKF